MHIVCMYIHYNTRTATFDLWTTDSSAVVRGKGFEGLHV